ncbi:DCC-interacting protein 13-alpha-like [Lingula anatina]|uniref:DCC-interacting protein 13-alpha-like n=1 Tax=Lingula anatina TaxID=7574 RepID=A0A1S3I0F4_LINAN|nr:DCC-interacting protein 13-alpha-like [Lingula anatina]|eukprot:XP_013390829.1 DCC-interacting protein 13-alpha-like [Lingula anatina]
MPEIEKLHLEDAFEDSPQTRSLLNVFERDAKRLKRYTSNLHECCQKIVNAQNDLTLGLQNLSQHLQAYSTMEFPLETEDSILSSTLKQFSVHVEELCSIQQILAAQLSDGMMYPLNKFLQADIAEIATMYEMYQIATHDMEQAMLKHMKIRKKESEKLKQEACEEVYIARKKFHQTALHYFTALNAVQYKRKTALLDPFLGMLHAYRAFFHMGQDRFSKEDIDDFVSNISASVQGVHKELALETQKTIEQMDKLEIETSPRYHVEVPAGEDSRPVNTMLGQKSGYLCLRSKQNMLASSKWDAHYFFTQGGNLMSQNRNELAGSLVCDLNEEGLHVESTESDDRRYVFQVVAPASKKTIILQAENEVEKEEWIQTIKNIAKEGGYVKERDPSETNKKERAESKSRSRSASSDSGAAKQQSSSSGWVIVEKVQGATRDTTPPATKIAPSGDLVLNTPIQFDLASPTDEVKDIGVKEGPQNADYWIQTIKNIAKEGGYVKERDPSETNKKERAESKSRSRSASSDSGAAKQQSSSSGWVIVEKVQGATRDTTPPATKIAPSGDLVLNTPIQFDLASPTDEVKDIGVKEGPQKRINPFDQTSLQMVADDHGAGTAFSQSFLVRFLGSMEVKTDRGEQLIYETMRQIMAARAIHNIFRMAESHLVVSSNEMKLLDPSSGSPRLKFSLMDVSFWAAHQDNKRLFAFITRNRGTTGTPPSFTCHVFECDLSGEEICQAITTATKMAFQAVMEKRAAEKEQAQRAREMKILMDNIQILDDVVEAEESQSENSLQQQASKQQQPKQNQSHKNSGDETVPECDSSVTAGQTPTDQLSCDGTPSILLSVTDEDEDEESEA